MTLPSKEYKKNSQTSLQQQVLFLLISKIWDGWMEIHYRYTNQFRPFNNPSCQQIEPWTKVLDPSNKLTMEHLSLSYCLRIYTVKGTILLYCISIFSNHFALLMWAISITKVLLKLDFHSKNIMRVNHDDAFIFRSEQDSADC